MRCALVCAVGIPLLLLFPRAESQLVAQRPQTREIERVAGSVGALALRVDAAPQVRAALVSAAKRVIASTVQLDKALGDRRISDSFGRSLDLNRVALERVAGRQTPVEQAVAVTQAVGDDLEVKTQFVQKSDPAQDVAVTARTLKDGREEKGLEVWYTPKAYEHDNREYKQYPNHSSPTENKLSAGAYVMWSRKAGADGARKHYDAGKDGSTTGAVDLAVPR